MTSPDNGFSLESIWWQRHTHGPDAQAYPEMIETLRHFLDALAGAKLDLENVQQLTQTLQSWREVLASHGVDEREQIFGRMMDIDGRAQAMVPKFVALESDRDRMRGTAVFGRYFLGGNGAAHGGAVSLLFDEVMGRLQHCALRPVARTAYLHVDYRAITPVDKPLGVAAWVVSEQGRKLLVKAEITDGDILCAEAEGLFITLRSGQP